MMKFLIKICGVTSPKDAEIVSKLGVDAIGVNFWPGSRRFVTDDKAAEILKVVPPGILKVGVFVNAHPLVVSESFAELGLDRVQLHGNEKVADYGGVEIGRIIRTIRVKDEATMKEAAAWEAGLYVYEGNVEGFGGQGAKGPWDLIARGARRPFLLAGGLTPENVTEAIRTVRPSGVDVATGVESEVGVKDPARLQAFVAAARSAADEITDPG